MNNDIIQSLWIGDRLSQLEQLSISSFLRNGHPYHLYVYNRELKGVPDGVEIKDGNEVIPSSDIFTCCGGSYAHFADWFRWALLFKRGGIWVDADVVCLKPFAFEDPIVFGIESSDLAGTAVLKFPAQHEICSLLAHNCRQPFEFLPYDRFKQKRKKLKQRLLGRKRSDTKWGATGGPKGFTHALKYFNMMELAKPFTYFYPIHSHNWNAIFDETLSDDINLFANSYALHLWNEMGRKVKLDKDGIFPPSSLFEQLKRRYL